MRELEMLLPLELPVEYEEVEQDWGGGREEHTGRAVAEPSLGEGVENSKYWETEGGKEEGEKDRHSIPRARGGSPK